MDVRLHTLPLSLSGVILGSFIALSKGYFNIIIFILTCITAVLFQIIANISNDYGDSINSINGIDNRIYKYDIFVIKKTIIISFLSSLILIFYSFKDDKKFIIPFIIGALICILAALDYTLNIIYTYGYKGLGDLMVFIFFGLISVIGTYFLYTHKLCYDILIPASSIGFLNTGILNINNMRDIENDKKNKKITIAGKLGLKNAKIYHTLLMYIPIILSIIIFQKYKNIYQWIFLIFFSTLIFNHIRNIFCKKNIYFNKELKIMSYIIFIYSLYMSIWYIL
ncbi:MAG: 1,4-dihydroxy-2-naphthoate octaprenyltransferase [Candidatus Bostrichicola ureolyticus]|nr:MAG: 1,4-dihydroxy-2-naphthoate octaprenyltransferase [Candidatus Bostrichicola ureolyticus]